MSNAKWSNEDVVCGAVGRAEDLEESRPEDDEDENA